MLMMYKKKVKCIENVMSKNNFFFYIFKKIKIKYIFICMFIIKKFFFFDNLLGFKKKKKSNIKTQMKKLNYLKIIRFLQR